MNSEGLTGWTGFDSVLYRRGQGETTVNPAVSVDLGVLPGAGDNPSTA